MPRPGLALALLTAGLVVGGCSGPPASREPAPVSVSATATATATATQAPAPATTPAPASATAAPAPAAATTVVIKDFVFVPETLTVPAGATVTVDNQDAANHTVTAVDGSFDTGNIAGRSNGTFTAPTKPGSYPYKCLIHPFMTGTLVVT